MSEFEKELLNKVSPHDRTHSGNELFLGGVLSEHFKDWQPPKKLVVVPQFVSDWFDINQDDIDGNIKALTRNIDRKLKIEWSEMDRWFMYSPNKPIETLISMKLYGYTVKKEQLYEVVFSKCKDGDRYLLFGNIEFFIGIESMNDGYYKQQFTEAEIKALDERYWQFAVPVDEV